MGYYTEKNLSLRLKAHARRTKEIFDKSYSNYHGVLAKVPVSLKWLAKLLSNLLSSTII